jgi:hypothetical protein
MKRGLRAKCNFYEDASNMTREEMNKILQQKLKDNMDKAVEIANKNIIRNEQGHVMISKDDEWLNDTEYDEIIEK